MNAPLPAPVVASLAAPVTAPTTAPLAAPTSGSACSLGRLATLAKACEPDEMPRSFLCASAVAVHTVRAATLDQPVLAIPLAGRKSMRADGDWLVADVGQALLLHRPAAVDLAHTPPADGGSYLAIGLNFSPEVLSAARTLWGRPTRAAGQALQAVELTPLLLPTLSAWADAALAGRDMALRHAATGVALQLCEMGCDGLLSQPEPSTGARIRAMVAAKPAREWRSEELELALGLSGATLRRRLAAEGTTLRQLIADARLAHALQLLYATRLPVKTVAQRVGYSSASSFVKRFGERYGMEPSRITGAPTV
jgi:AraC-like DNA-binding protein